MYPAPDSQSGAIGHSANSPKKHNGRGLRLRTIVTGKPWEPECRQARKPLRAFFMRGLTFFSAPKSSHDGNLTAV
jgi:hypothetical protein